MRIIIQNIALLTLLSFLASCAGDKPASNSTVEDKAANTSSTSLTIKGKVTGLASGTSIILDESPLSTLKENKKVNLTEDNTFKLTTDIGSPGIFRLRLGDVFVWLALEGGETIDLDASLNGKQLSTLKIEGSKQSKMIMDLVMSQPKPEQLAQRVKERDKDMALANLLLVQGLQPQSHIELYKEVRNELKAKYPDIAATRNFDNKVKTYAAQISAQPLKIGKPVPNIEMENPQGKKMALKDLRGKVVLVDFWASWCRPCRMENPNVVNVYNEYNKKGFEVFSVSLDGLDDRQAAQLQNNPSQLKQALESQKQRWTTAIAQDGLKWPYHVSELRRWSTSVVKQFGIRGIPFTVLVDRDGVVRYMNVRGDALEKKVKELLG